MSWLVYAKINMAKIISMPRLEGLRWMNKKPIERGSGPWP